MNEVENFREIALKCKNEQRKLYQNSTIVQNYTLFSSS